MTLLEETTKELYISVDNGIAEWEIINKQIQTLDFQRDIESTQEKRVNQKVKSIDKYIRTPITQTPISLGFHPTFQSFLLG